MRIAFHSRGSGREPGFGLTLLRRAGLWAWFILGLWWFCGALPARGQSQAGRPALLRDVGIDQKLNGQIPLDLSFRDESGKTVQLREFFGEKPAILTLVYYECPMLCTQVLNGLVRSLKDIQLGAGEDFSIVIVSIDPRETPELAASKKRIYAGLYGRPKAQAGWHFLTGEEAPIRELAKAVGFRYAYDPESGQYAHATAIMVLTPAGRVSRYYYGIEYLPRDLRLGLVEASAGRIGSAVDQILLFCYHYDPATGKYGLIISRVTQAAGLATVLILGFSVLVMFRGEKYKKIPGPADEKGGASARAR